MAEQEIIEVIDLKNQSIPFLPLRDIVVFPHTVMPLFVGRKKSINAITKSLGTHKHIFLITQKEDKKEDPNLEDLYEIGTVATILQMIKLPDGTVKILVEGISKARIIETIENDGVVEVKVEETVSKNKNNIELEAVRRLILDTFNEYVRMNKKIPEEIILTLEETEDVDRFGDIITANLKLNLIEKQKLLAEENALTRLETVLKLVSKELEMISVEQKVHNRVRKQMENNHREYYLNEQMKSIKKELGDIDNDNEIEELSKKIKKAKMSKEGAEKANSELKKLSQMSASSSDASIIRTYIDNLCDLPWHKKTMINKDLNKAQQCLDKDHYGLDKVKERILEYLAVQNRVSKNKANILCLVGPPGVGKTSLGKSIAKAVNRKYIRMALGGVRDEAEIRGHRRTYIGALPGTIIQKMQKAKVKNPLFLLDEIDKISGERGDTASALLEVLDPEQNHTFNDHYIEVDYDLSETMFVATANSLNLPEALLDRMEIIHLEGYTEDEKLAIAQNYLVDKQRINNGLKKTEIKFEDSAILDIVRYYTREAGVRNLAREVSKICRKTVKGILLKEINKKQVIKDKNIKEFLGVKKYRFGLAEDKNQIGEVTGLAWTSVGGDLLTIEAVANKGKGKLTHTGQLGDVMKESIQAAMAVVRSRADKLNIAEDFYEKLDIHLHMPDGATPKDGPSAGAAICTALVSVLTKRKVKASVAMTGEITLRGEVTPIGGLKEKLLAALRGGIKTVLIPEENERELSEVPENIKSGLEIIKVRWIEDVLKVALEK
ncbi:ATP-dependent protease La Type I [hydrothermal vent metagenome]|uniref:endopeptidase La n=1 Tax=hydrothermal vent metagenome TaxID=652676 RepID=A0A1W1CM96_9ZZZZ